MFGSLIQTMAGPALLSTLRWAKSSYFVTITAQHASGCFQIALSCAACIPMSLTCSASCPFGKPAGEGGPELRVNEEPDQATRKTG